MIAIAEARGGKLLSRTYVNDGTKLRWRCAEGHTWETTPNIIKHGGWCGICGRRRAAEKRIVHTIVEMRTLAKKLGGVCLSAAYLGFNRKLRWRCRLGHEWQTLPMVVLKGHWCPKCGSQSAGDKQRLTMQDIQNTAEARGGACLSKKYVNAHQKLVWRCSSGHRWRANANMVRRGTWCPTCARKRRLAPG